MLHQPLDDTVLTDIYRLTDVAGVLCNGILGGRLARTRGFDFVGFAILAIMSGMGGGIVRDVMLNLVPVAMTDPLYLSSALVGAAIAFLWRFDSRISNRLLLLADALCLGCWAAVGTAKTLDLGLGIMPALLMGLITAIGGGMIRDISAGMVPRIFGGNSLYATPAFASALVMLIFWELELAIIGNGVAILVCVCFVVLSHWRKWILPQAPEVTITMTTRQFKQLKKMLYRSSEVPKSPRKNRMFGLPYLDALSFPTGPRLLPAPPKLSKLKAELPEKSPSLWKKKGQAGDKTQPNPDRPESGFPTC